MATADGVWGSGVCEELVAGGVGATAAAAAAAYRIGGKVAGAGRGAGTRPALRILAIGC